MLTIGLVQRLRDVFVVKFKKRSQESEWEPEIQKNRGTVAMVGITQWRVVLLHNLLSIPVTTERAPPLTQLLDKQAV